VGNEDCSTVGEVEVRNKQPRNKNRSDKCDNSTLLMMKLDECVNQSISLSYVIFAP